MGKIFAYCRTSSIKQDNSLEEQERRLKELGATHIYKEKVSGTSTGQRTELKALLKAIGQDDKILITKIDRLARSVVDLNNLVDEIVLKGASVRFVDNNLEFNSQSHDPMNKMVKSMLGVFAEFERDLIYARCQEGRDRARAEGRSLGRKREATDEQVKRALKMYAEKDTNGLTVRDILDATGVKRTNFYKELKIHEAMKQDTTK